MRLIKATVEGLFCSRKFHQIDGTEERARVIVHTALERHVAEDHPERVQ